MITSSLRYLSEVSVTNNKALIHSLLAMTSPALERFLKRNSLWRESLTTLSPRETIKDGVDRMISDFQSGIREGPYLAAHHDRETQTARGTIGDLVENEHDAVENEHEDVIENEDELRLWPCLQQNKIS